MRARRPEEKELIGAFLLAAGLAWWWTVERMAGMDMGPGTGLGTLGWFAGVWVVMMAAMMLPSLAPGAAAEAARAGRRRSYALLFACGYLLVWAAAGVLAYALFTLGRDALGASFAWHAGGRWLAGGVLALAACYELTPLKSSCLSRCRDPSRDLPGASARDRFGGLEGGVRNGAWCVGCSFALMAALFALGVMSVTWMVLVAALVALEKLLPMRRAGVAAAAALLLGLAVLLLAAPRDVPGLVVPGGRGAMADLGGGRARSAAVPEPHILWDPIPFGPARKAQMVAYVRRHNGSFMKPTYRLVDPHVIVIHYAETPTFQATYNTFAPDTLDPELHELPNTCAHIGHNESLSSPYHREDVPSLRHQTHSDFVHADMQVYRRRLAAAGGCG